MDETVLLDESTLKRSSNPELMEMGLKRLDEYNGIMSHWKDELELRRIALMAEMAMIRHELETRGVVVLLF